MSKLIFIGINFTCLVFKIFNFNYFCGGQEKYLIRDGFNTGTKHFNNSDLNVMYLNSFFHGNFFTLNILPQINLYFD